MSTLRRLALLFGLALLFVAPAWGGGPLLVTNTDPPIRGAFSTAAPVQFNPDQGGLGALSNSQAVTFVGELFQVWQDVPTSSISFTQGSALPEDVTTADRLAVYPDASHPGPIVFDTDGTLTDAVLGANQSNFVLGFAGPRSYFPATGEIVNARAVLNGEWIDGVNSDTNPEISLELYRGVFIHEFGHFFNLDHSQINLDDAFDSNTGNDNGVPTMNPFVFGAEGGTLHRDDMAAVSSIYPDPGFATSTGTIEGEVFSTAGVSFQGANVIARNVADPKVTAVSCVSGYLFQGSSAGFGTANTAFRGRYRLEGLPPGNYTVEIEPVDLRFSGGSGVGPIRSPSPAIGIPFEFWNGTRESSDPTTDPTDEAVVIPLVAGQTVSGVNIRLNHSQGVSQFFSAGDTGGALDNTQLVLTPSPSSPGGYTVRRITGVTSFPHNAAGDVLVSLSDDDFQTIDSLGVRLPVFGTRYSVANICSNGYITFGDPLTEGPEGSINFTEFDHDPTPQEQAGPNPHISALYTDLNPLAGGTVRRGLYTTGLFVTFTAVRLFNSANTVSFQIHLAPSGVITITYGDVSFAAAGGGAVGVSSGGTYNASFAAPLSIASLVNDTTDPSVTITSPAQDSTVSGTTTVTYTVSDTAPSSGISKSQLYVDGALVNSVTGAANLTWDTTQYSNGRKRVEVWSFDRSGRIGRAGTDLIVNNAGGVRIVQSISGISQSGSVLTLTLTVRNDSPTTATSVRLQQFWVEGLAPSAAGIRRIYCNPTSGSLLPAALPNLAPGASTTIQLRGFVPSDVTGFRSAVSVLQATVGGINYTF